MLHHRSPTSTGYPSIHAALALRHVHPSSIPTLLSPLRSVANSPLDPLDEFQSNAWIDSPSHFPPLAGLGITYLRDASTNPLDQPLAPDDSALRMRVDDHDRSLLFPDEARGAAQDCFSAQYRGLESTSGGTSAMNLSFEGDFDPTASDMVGLIPDVNMFDDLRRLDLPRPGVNPLDTIRSPLPDDRIFYEATPPMPKDQLDYEIPSATDAEGEQTPSPRVIQDIMSILIQPARQSPLLPWQPADSPAAHTLSPACLAASISSVSVKVEPSNIIDSEHPCSSTTHASPILNAHLGIGLAELVSKAERFKTRYPERDIDRAWLSHFAGKLSDRGELLNDFRCYVIGCNQRNKRRDHILVHVGAHIGQRPFICSVCPMRFLRKNECKRHEASHSGSRPYSCDICGQSFVRQDLVKRHVKRTHGVRDENQFGVARPSRKRTRIR